MKEFFAALVIISGAYYFGYHNRAVYPIPKSFLEQCADSSKDSYKYGYTDGYQKAIDNVGTHAYYSGYADGVAEESKIDDTFYNNLMKGKYKVIHSVTTVVAVPKPVYKQEKIIEIVPNIICNGKKCTQGITHEENDNESK